MEIEKQIIFGLCVGFIMGAIVGLIGLTYWDKFQKSTDQQAWQDCRTEAWNSCKVSESSNIYNYFGERASNEEWKKLQLLFDVVDMCWDTKAQICDSQFDMSKIETAKLEVKLVGVN